MSLFRRTGAEVLRTLARALDPAAAANEIQVYSKLDVGVAQLFARDSAGVVYQLTPGGAYEYAEWRSNGTLVVLSSDDTAWLGRAAIAYTIVGVEVYRAIAGTGGQTRINLALGANGAAAVDLYTVGARPTIAAAAGNFVHLTAGLPDISTAVPAGSRLELNVQEVETGTPTDLSVRVTLLAA